MGLRLLRRRGRAQGIAALVLVGSIVTPRGAHATTAGVDQAARVAVSLDILVDGAGNVAYGTPLVIRDPDGTTTLRIRICTQAPLCTDYFQAIYPSQFTVDPRYPDYMATVVADVPSLGTVSIRFVCTHDLTRNLLVGNANNRVVVVGFSGVNPTVCGGGDTYGDTIGPWWVYTGYGGFIGHDGIVYWVEP